MTSSLANGISCRDRPEDDRASEEYSTNDRCRECQSSGDTYDSKKPPYQIVANTVIPGVRTAPQGRRVGDAQRS
jgi:hypothetical protein